MSVGQTHVSAKFVSNMSITGLASLWASDTIKMAIITNAQTPGINDSDPRWGSGGSQNYSTAEVTPGGNYSAGGVSLSGTTSTLSGAVTSLERDESYQHRRECLESHGRVLGDLL